jgi:hypothetical protein
MNYKVKAMHIFCNVVDVEANDIDEARSLALEKIKSGVNTHNQTDVFAEKVSFDIIYDSTIEPHKWPVITEEEFQNLVKEHNKDININKEEDIFIYNN